MGPGFMGGVHQAQCNSFPVACLLGEHPGSRDSCGSTQWPCFKPFTSAAAGKGQSCHYPTLPKVLNLCWEGAVSGIQSPLAPGSEWETEEGRFPKAQPTQLCALPAGPPCNALTVPTLSPHSCPHQPRAVCPSCPSLPVPRAAGAVPGLSLSPGDPSGSVTSWCSVEMPSVSLARWDRQKAEGADWLLFHFPFPKLPEPLGGWGWSCGMISVLSLPRGAVPHCPPQRDGPGAALVVPRQES